MDRDQHSLEKLTTTKDNSLGHVVNYDNITYTTRSEYISALNTGKFVPGTYKCNNVSISDISRSDDSGYAEVQTSSTKVRSTGVIGAKIPLINLDYINNFQVSDVAMRKSLVLTDAYAKVNDPESFDGGVFLGELAETIGMLKHPLAGVSNLLRKRMWADPLSLVKAGADTWMEFRYGIRPFVNDVQAIVKLFHEKEARFNGSLSTKRSGLTDTSNMVKTLSTSHYTGYNYLYVYYNARASISQNYTSGVTYKRLVENEPLMHRLGLSLENAPSTLYEMVPLSFVADWFLNIGRWLKAISPNPYVQLLGAFTSVKTTISLQYNATHSVYLGVTGTAKATGTCIHERLNRSCTTALPSLPSIENDVMSLSRAVDSAILAQQRMPKAWNKAIKRAFLDGINNNRQKMF